MSVMPPVDDLIAALSPEAGRWLRPVVIEGIEVSQGIQTYRSARHLLRPEHHYPDNALTLVAARAAWVRVYVTARFVDVPDVRATAVLRRRSLLGWEDVVELARRGPVSLTIPARQRYAERRQSTWRTLNFFIPAALMLGPISVRVEVTAPGMDPIVDHIAVDASLHQELRIRAIPIRYTGPGVQPPLAAPLEAPTLADLSSSLAHTLRWFPVAQTPQLSLTAPVELAEPLTGTMSEGQCPLSWRTLLDVLHRARALDGQRPGTMYYGLLPIGVPWTDTTGCGGPGMAAGFVGDGAAMAHELGHACGLGHAPCGLPNDDNTWVGYPDYPPYDVAGSPSRASIGEYGLDVNTGDVIDPAWGKDLQSYCGPQWMSVHHHLRLIRHPLLNPSYRSYGVDRPRFVEVGSYRKDRDLPYPSPLRRVPDLRERIVISGDVTHGTVTIRTLHRVASSDPAEGRTVPGLRAQVLDADGAVLRERAVRQVVRTSCGAGCASTSSASGCGCAGDANSLDDPQATGSFAVVLDAGEFDAEIRIVRDEDVVAERLAEGKPPWVAFFAEMDGDRMILQWDPARDDHEVAAQWSDDGEHWQVLAPQLTQGRADLSCALLPARPVQVRLAISDGWFTTLTESVQVDPPGRDPELTIVFPLDGSVLAADTQLRLWGFGVDDQGHPVPDDQLTWLLDDVEVGMGAEVVLPQTPTLGHHHVVLEHRGVAGAGTDAGSCRVSANVQVIEELPL